jgi:outer membrane immunogenic protein
MSKLSVAGAAAAIVIAGPAMAADMAVKARPIAFESAYNWSGFYVGANAGAVWSRSDVNLVSSPFFGPGGVGGPDGQSSLNRDGSRRLTGTNFLVGGQLGYNWQVGRFVLGVEGSIDSVNFKRSFDTGILPTPPLSPGLGSYRFADTAKSSWLATVGPRVGYTFDNFLVYVSGGAAFGDVALSTTSGPFIGCGGCLVSSQASSTKAGWFVGAGVEYGINSYLSVKGEYLHADLGSINFTDNLAAGGFPAASFAHSDKLTQDLVRVGLNLRLPAAAPASAKY